MQVELTLKRPIFCTFFGLRGSSILNFQRPLMPRPQDERYALSDAEKRDLIALIQAGRPLPEKYRFLLFEDKREVELVRRRAG